VTVPNKHPGKNNIFVVGGYNTDVGWRGYPPTHYQRVHGRVSHYNGLTWRPSSITCTKVLDVFGTGPNNVYLVTWDAKCYNYDGQMWRNMRLPNTISSYYYLRGIWASSPNDVFVVGDRRRGRYKRNINTILHYNGTSWSEMEHPYNDGSLNDVWGTGPNDVFVVGQNGTILHYDGKFWQEETELSHYALTAVWGTGPNDVFAVGALCTILHYDGESWTESPVKLQSGFDKFMKGKRGHTLYDIWGTGSNNVFAVGQDAILHYDGHVWKYQ